MNQELIDQLTQSLSGLNFASPGLITGDPTTFLNGLTVGQFRTLINQTKNLLQTQDFSSLSFLLNDPNLSGNLDGQTRKLINDLIDGDFSFFTAAFDVALEAVAGFAASAALLTALTGGGDTGGGDTGGGGVTPAVKTFLDEVADLFRGSADRDDITARAEIGRILSGGGDDTVRGSVFEDFIKGGGGDDVLRGRGGDDDLRGGGGSDKVLGGGGKRLGVSELSKRAYLYDHETPRELTGVRHTAYVKIAEGCDRPCGFCIIPKLRGAQRSRDVFSVVQEVHALVGAGTKEICLVAQDLTRYGSDLETPTNLEMLLDALVEVEGLEWIRLHYAYPSAVTDGLIERIAMQPKVATYLDVPMQHVDSDVLKVMRRGYGERAVLELAQKLRDAKTSEGQRLWLRTTMLVGHPGETPEAYARLKDFVSQGFIDHLGVFPWSREDGTVSAMKPGRVEEAIAAERAAELMQIQEAIRAERHAALVGQPIRVLVDGPSSESDLLLDGRHEGQAPEIDGKVVLTDGTAQRGDMVMATITQASAHDLIASLDPEAAAEAIAQQ